MNPAAYRVVAQTAIAAQGAQTSTLKLCYQNDLYLLCTASLNIQAAFAQLHARYHNLPPAVRNDPRIEPINRLAVLHELDLEAVSLPTVEAEKTIFAEILRKLHNCISTAHGCLLLGPLAEAERAFAAADGYVDEAETYLLGLEVAVEQHVQAAATTVDRAVGEEDAPGPYEAAMDDQEAAEWDALIAVMRASAPAAIRLA
ncbi:hypothetical protein LTR85_002348 [Meristemomyces frigidus]|nr:hypothetical protein LTR85_002348 [Meristemomyces frigidus]